MSDTRIYDTYVAGRGSAALAVGVRLGLFSRLAEGPADVATLAASLDASERGVRSLCRALRGLGLIEDGADGFSLAADAANYLVPGRTGYLGGLIDMEFDAWMSPAALLAAVKKGRAGVYGADDMWAEHAQDPERTARFADMMTAISAGPAEALACLDLFADKTHLLDVGGGAGVFVMAALRAHAHLRATLYDIPAVQPLAEAGFASAGLADRAGVVVGDMFHEAWPTGVDVILLSQILHDWTEAQCDDLLARAFAALEPGGIILVHEKFVESDGGPAANALVDLDMLFWTEGQQLTPTGILSAFETAGFTDGRVVPTTGYWSVAVGTKPAR